jgi:hypothetical protein
VAELRAKLVDDSVRANVDIRLGGIDDLTPALSGPFDGVISSFAALNTVDLSALAPQATRLLRPGGRLICHMLSTRYGRSALARLFGRPTGATADGVKTIDVGPESLRHSTVDPDELYRRFFAGGFERRRCYALGLLVSGRMDARLPEPLLDFIGRFESIIGAAPPLASRGRFFVLDLERRRQP